MSDIKIYAGIGARKTPPDILNIMHKWAEFAAQQGWILADGAAPGADQAFTRGALYRYGKVQLHLPWAKYEEEWIRSLGTADIDIYVLADGDVAAFKSVKQFHPNPQVLSSAVWRLHARNYNIVTPSHHVICYTPNGKGGGGTGQGIRIARYQSKPVYDLGNPVTRRNFEQSLRANGYL